MNGKKNRANKFRKIILNLDEVLGYIALTAVVLFTSINVILRYVFKFTISAAEEIALIGFIWASYLGVAAAYKSGDHMDIDLIVNILPPKLKISIETLVDIIAVATSLVLTFLSAKLSISAGNKSTYVMSLPYFYVNMSVIISFFLLSIYGIKNLILRTKELIATFRK